jgi:hypothetical protein
MEIFCSDGRCDAVFTCKGDHEKKHTQFPVVGCPSCQGYVPYFGLSVHEVSCDGFELSNKFLCHLFDDTFPSIPALYQQIVRHILAKQDVEARFNRYNIDIEQFHQT